MKRVIVCAALVACLGGTAGAGAAGQQQVVTGGGFLSYDRNGLQTGVLECNARADGGALGLALWVQITRCSLTSSAGGSINAPALIVPGPNGITAGAGQIHDAGVHTLCISATAHYGDGHTVSAARCDTL
jgi:hypothetical protein